MSNTPRTDAVADYWLEPGMSAEHEIVPAQIARELERELATERALADRLAQAIQTHRNQFPDEALDGDLRLWSFVDEWKAARNEADH